MFHGSRANCAHSEWRTACYVDWRTTAMNRRPLIVRLCHIRSILILFIPVIVVALASGSTAANAEESPPQAPTPSEAPSAAAPPPLAPSTRQAVIEQEQAAKVETLQPVALGKGERAT